MFTLVIVLLIVFAAGPLFLQDQSSLEASSSPTPEDVATIRDLMHALRSASGDVPDASKLLRTNADQLNSAVRIGSRFIKDFRGRVIIEPTQAVGEASIPVLWWSGHKWLNISGAVPSRITLGATDIPPFLAVALGHIGINLILGNELGDRMLQAASGMDISDGELILSIAIY